MKHMVFYLIMLLSISCSNRQKELSYQEPFFPIEQHIPAQILTDTALIAYPYDLNVYDSYLYLLSLVDGNWLHIYNKHTGEMGLFWYQTRTGSDEIATGTVLFWKEKQNPYTYTTQANPNYWGFLLIKRRNLSLVSAINHS